MSRGLSGEDVAIPDRKLPALATEGTWNERDGACAGSRWTVGPNADGRTSVTGEWRCGATTGSQPAQALVWKTPRILAGQLAGDSRQGQVLLMFVSDTRALLVVKDGAGAPSTFTVLQKAR